MAYWLKIVVSYPQEVAPAGPGTCALPDQAASAAPPGGATAASRQEGDGDAAADGEPWGYADGNPFDDACELIGLRLLNPASSAAATMALRPHLQVRLSMSGTMQCAFAV